MTQPLLSRRGDNDQVELAATGSWTAEHVAELERLVDPLNLDIRDPQQSVIDIAGVRELDTFGAWLIEKLRRIASLRGREPSLVGVAERFRGLIEEVRETNRRPARQIPARNRLIAQVELLGRRAAEIAQDFLTLMAVLGELGNSLPRAVRRPATLISIVHHLDRVAWQAAPIVLLITFLIGGIIAQQGIFHFRKFGADDYVVDLVGILVLREIGVLLVAIMVAGRSGSSYTAELGSMKMREEIDALRTMGLDPVEILIFPRVFALVGALPILTFLGSMAALVGGGLVAWLYGGMSPEIFIDRLREAVSIDHFKVGIIKAPFMALVIGAVAASEGLKVKGSAESLGLQTTTSVVKSIFFVIVLDGLFAIFFASIGM
ncbi:MAG TPA: MlaE family lipid ABC transporter permease subunit [Xanthobacteraceae bacterium]|jgi:phospholipid/cholesterol/gamma-HCH transport system permease protein